MSIKINHPFSGQTLGFFEKFCIFLGLFWINVSLEFQKPIEFLFSLLYSGMRLFIATFMETTNCGGRGKFNRSFVCQGDKE